MNTTAMVNLAFDGFSRFARSEETGIEYSGSVWEEAPALRLALIYGEELRIPCSSKKLRVLSGTAWVSMGGDDYILVEGECLAITMTKGGAIISALLGEAIFFELS